MRTLSFLCFLAVGVVSAQTEEVPLALPMDNGSTVSFCESIKTGFRSKAYFDGLCERIQHVGYMKDPAISECSMSIRMDVDRGGHRIQGTMIITRSRGSVEYCFHEYTVDSIPVDHWLKEAPSKAAEDVKSAIFSSSVIAIAEMKDVRIASNQ